MPRYLFILPQVERPTGGVNVALQMIEILQDAGHEAHPLYSDGNHQYDFWETPRQSYFYPPLVEVRRRLISRRGRLQAKLREFMSVRRTGRNAELELQPDDVVVLPDFLYGEYDAVFPAQRRLLLVQGTYPFCRALKRDIGKGLRTIDTFEAVITISEATSNAVSQFAKRDSFEVTQSISRSSLDPSIPKQRQIAYMPRRRPDEIELLLGCLKDVPALRNWTFRAIDGAGREEVDRLLSESLIFLSFSEKEGFGLPPAEAMAAGCIVIGYTGVGGEEFFQPGVGIPIPDGDIVAFAKSLEDTVCEYEADPARLDAMRLKAAEQISSRYTPEAMRKSLLVAWAEIEKT